MIRFVIVLKEHEMIILTFPKKIKNTVEIRNFMISAQLSRDVYFL